MSKKSTTEEFVAKAEKKHPNIDFSKVRYINAITDVSLICKTCGLEWEAVPNSILNGHGCPHCGRASLIYGVGVNDVPLPTRQGSSRDDAYRTWKSMLERCYSEKHQKKNPAYIGCSVCKEWWLFSNFKKWFDDPTNGYMKGYELDKDILIQGNRVYSPSTCCFVPSEINSIVSRRGDSGKNGGFVGVSVRKKGKKKYHAELRKNGKRIRLGYFYTPKDAFNAYIQAKEAHVRCVAEEHFRDGKITEKVYNALMNYKVRNDV